MRVLRKVSYLKYREDVAFRGLYLRVIGFITIGLSLTNILAIAIGGQSPPHLALRGFLTDCEDKPKPCWYGIVPGETSVAEAQEILNGLGYTPSRRSSYGIITYGAMEGMIDCTVQATYRESTGPIRALRFRDCSAIRFGDFGITFGRPDRLLLDLNQHSVIYDRERNLFLEGRRLSPYNPVAHFELSTEYVSWTGIVEWRGFIVRARYCREQLMRYGHQGC